MVKGSFTYCLPALYFLQMLVLGNKPKEIFEIVELKPELG